MRYDTPMDFDVRSGEYLFKHATDAGPQIDSAHHIPHSHHSFELFYFISGDGKYYVGEEAYTLYPGSILLIRPGVMHHLHIRDTEPYERIVIRFPEDDLAEALREGLSQKDNFYFVRNSEVGKEILQLDVHFSNIVDDMILSTFKIALYLILTYIINFRPDKSGANAENDKITRVVDYIDRHLTDIDSLESLCRELHMSKSALSKLFTSEMGVPIMRYIRYKKCVTAQALLQKGIPPTVAYAEAGFNDYFSFYRMYTQIYKHAPSRGKWAHSATEGTENCNNNGV